MSLLFYKLSDRVWEETLLLSGPMIEKQVNHYSNDEFICVSKKCLKVMLGFIRNELECASPHPCTCRRGIHLNKTNKSHRVITSKYQVREELS